MNRQTCFFAAKDAMERKGVVFPLRTFAPFAVGCLLMQGDGFFHAK
ncbi:MAG: hypothetical protein Q8N54_03285 [Sulfurimicrobium sp.]|nr:hypothetical protein [Sulfurimicrobium sp.]MDZ7656462.1 hypothetical protein [Sulfurimicrobium sp.]